MFEGMIYNQNKAFPGNYTYALFDNPYKFCPECLVSDRIEYGESYIHRVHQLNFVHICPIHRVYLIQHCYSCNQPLSSYYNMYQPTSESCPHCAKDLPSVPVVQSDTSDFLLNLSVDCLTLLQVKNHPQHITRHKYATLLWINGYKTGEKHHNNKALSTNLITYYKIENLLKVNLSIDYLKTRLALTKADFREPKTNPLVHMLLMRFLLGSAEKFIEYETPQLASPVYWGHGPWACINPLCSQFNDPVITRCSKRVSKVEYGKKLFATFKCPMCGYTFRINAGADKAYTIDHGELWYKILTSAHTDEDVANIAIKICKSKGDTNKQIKLARKKGTRVSESDLTAQLRMKKIKEKILSLTSNNNTLKRQEITNLVGIQDYAWLRKKDPEWINNTLPQRTMGNFKRKNWKKEDERISILVMQAGKELYKSQYSKRILTYTILGQLSAQDKGFFLNRRLDLPKTSETLENLIESYEAYQIRRIPITAAYLKKFNKSVSLSNFLRLDPYKNCSSSVINHINSFIDQLKEGV